MYFIKILNFNLKFWKLSKQACVVADESIEHVALGSPLIKAG